MNHQKMAAGAFSGLAVLLLFLGGGCDVRPHGEPDSGAIVERCGPSNCEGCCAQGICLTGYRDDTCGRGGAACGECAAPASCSAGQCRVLDGGSVVDAGGPCGPANCAGCCRFDGQCQTVDNFDCGLNGTGCVDCGTTGICNRPSGKCLQPHAPCSPSTCDGCCDSAGFCIQKNARSNSHCGIGGGTCRYCFSSFNQVCDFDRGSCVARTAKCGAIDCEGCCDSAQVCRSGLEAEACGWGGVACQACFSGTSCHGPAAEGTLSKACR